MKIVFFVTIAAAIWMLHKLAETSRFQLFGDLINHVYTKEKVIALTYDDGPNPPYTDFLLEVLEGFNVKATFFLIGKNIEQNSKTACLILQQGHELGNHSYSHKKMIFRTWPFVVAEIAKTEALLRASGVHGQIHFRAPFGYKRFVLPLVLFSMNKKNILWDIDTKDWSHDSFLEQESDIQAIVNSILEHVRPGSIILLHDGGGNRQLTVDATARVIPLLRNQGYRFATVSELLSLTD